MRKSQGGVDPHPARPMTAPDRGFQVRALGEIAIRCRDRGAMTAFYRDVLGLTLLAERDRGITFFEIAPGYAGHTTVLALFDGEPSAGPGALHHIALSIGYDEQAAAIAWYDRVGQPYRIEHFDWIGWRGVFTEDPEGNTVELVAAIPGAPA